MRHLLQSCLLGLCAVLATSAHADIVIGHVLPLSGADAAAGEQMRLGAKAYIDQANAMGGVGGQRLVYVASDDAGQSARTVARARELIIRDHAVGLLAGTSLANINALTQSGLPRKYQVPVVGATAGAGDMGAMTRARQVGLVAVPQQPTQALVEEFKQAMARNGSPGGQPTELALQGYIAAKVMVGGLRLFGDELAQSEFYFLMRNMVPDLSSHLMRRSDVPA